MAASGSNIVAEGCAPGTGAIDPGETVTVNFAVTNAGTSATTNLVATLVASSGVVDPGPPATYGTIAAGATASQPIQFTANGACGGVITATIQLQDGAADLGNVTYTFNLGANTGSTQSFSNAAAISIPINGGTATPYPSTINIAGITGTVTKVTVTINDFSHTFPDEVDMLLVGPQGQNVMLMSDAGEGLDVTDAQLTFDDAALFMLPNGPGITSGTYKPTDYEINSMPAPAPPLPFGSALSVFNGANPNGAWKLYVFDDTAGDGGSIAGGWTLTISTSRPVCCVGPGTLQFSASTYAVTEGPAGARVTITRTNGADGDVGVTVSTSDGTAHAGSDYVATTETVTWSSGDATAKTVVIPQIDDAIDEDDETINVQLSNVTGGAAIGARANSVVTILDNDPSPVRSVNDVSIVEGNSGTKTATFTLSLSASSIRTISVAWATADGTAAAGSDYVATSGTTTFTPGETSHTVDVTINGDTSNERDETFLLAFTNPIAVTLARAQAVGTIVSDDILNVASIAPTSGPASGGTNVTIGGATFEDGASVSFGTVAATNVVVSGGGQITATTPSIAPGTLHDVTVTNANSISATLPRGFMADFLDVPQANPFHGVIENIFRRGITAGCTNGNYCPNDAIARSQMAVFLLRAEHGQTYVPPPATGTIFADVPANAFAASFIEQLYNEGVTAGCSSSPRNYCPGDPVTRAQMAVFLLRTSRGSGYVPPAATGVFGDVSTSSPFASWIEALYHAGITAGCSADPVLYCPNQSALRGQMAAFVSTTFP